MRAERPLWNPYLAGVVLGLVLFAAFFVSGHGLGASGGFARLLAWGMEGLSPEHLRTNPYFTRYAESPLAHWILPLLLGVALGGAVSGWQGGRMRVATFRGPRVGVRTRWALALLGGAVAGYGSRLARGCTSGQALSGGATLSLGSWALMLAVFGGGYLLAYFVRRLWN